MAFVPYVLLAVSAGFSAWALVALRAFHVDRAAFAAALGRMLERADVPRAVKLCSAATPAALPGVVKRALVVAASYPDDAAGLAGALRARVEDDLHAIAARLAVLRVPAWAAGLAVLLAAAFDVAWTRAAAAPFVAAAGACLVLAGVAGALPGALERSVREGAEALLPALADGIQRYRLAPPAPATTPFRTASQPAPERAPDPPDASVLYLRVSAGTQPAVTLRFADFSKPLRIGRGPDADLALDDPAVARMHLVITREAGALKAVDLGADAGTLVNDARLTVAQLRHGDVLTVGAARIVVGLGAPAEGP